MDSVIPSEMLDLIAWVERGHGWSLGKRMPVIVLGLLSIIWTFANRFLFSGNIWLPFLLFPAFGIFRLLCLLSAVTESITMLDGSASGFSPRAFTPCLDLENLPLKLDTVRNGPR